MKKNCTVCIAQHMALHGLQEIRKALNANCCTPDACIGMTERPLTGFQAQLLCHVHPCCCDFCTIGCHRLPPWQQKRSVAQRSAVSLRGLRTPSAAHR